jgi:signal peptidase I
MASPEDGIQLVKRIVGLPGDRVSMKHKLLTINGVRVEYDRIGHPQEFQLPGGASTVAVTATERLPGREHIVTFTEGVNANSDFEEIVVPEGYYFFLGDNRDVSKDARIIGPVALEKIYGPASHVAPSVDPANTYRPRFERWFTRL